MDTKKYSKGEFTIFQANEKFAIREHPQKENIFRDSFDRDRDRIIFSKEFRRLEGKTQVFINGFDDHIRNRLTHTLEVSQISQTLSSFLGLNKSLAEAISLGHDVGHTPFGHVGEKILNYLTNNCDPYMNFKISNNNELGFKHNWQGIKVTSSLEKISESYDGLNLTDFTLWGILNHTDLEYKKCKDKMICESIESSNSIDGITKKPICKNRNSEKICHLPETNFSLSHYNKYKYLIKSSSWTFEGVIVNFADEIAQRHHDVEDGIIANIIGRKEFVKIFKEFFNVFLTDKDNDLLNKITSSETLNCALHDIASLILSFYSRQLFNNTARNLENFKKSNNISSSINFHERKSELLNNISVSSIICYSEEFSVIEEQFQKYLYSRILNSHLTQSMDGKSSHILRSLIKAYISNPKQLPDGTIDILTKNLYSKSEYEKFKKGISPQLAISNMRSNTSMYNSNEEHFKTILIRTITDFIAGMTDRFAISQYRMLYGTENFWDHYKIL